MLPGPLTIKSVPSCQRIYGHESPFSDPLFTNLLLTHFPSTRRPDLSMCKITLRPKPISRPSFRSHTQHTHILTYIPKTQQLPALTCCRIGRSQMCPAIKRQPSLAFKSREGGKSQGQTALFTPKEQGP